MAGLLGVLSVTGRQLLTATSRRIRLSTVVATVFALQAGAALHLSLVAGSRIGAVIAVIAVTGFGLGFGVTSLANPALLTDRHGAIVYASIVGTLAAPVTLAKATAPLAAATLYTRASNYLPVMAVVSGLLILATPGIRTAERVRLDVAGLHEEHATWLNGFVSVSVGVASAVPSQAGSIIQLFQRADLGLMRPNETAVIASTLPLLRPIAGEATPGDVQQLNEPPSSVSYVDPVGEPFVDEV